MQVGELLTGHKLGPVAAGGKVDVKQVSGREALREETEKMQGRDAQYKDAVVCFDMVLIFRMIA